MNKEEFINSLRRELGSLPQKEIEDIIYDYEEHFQIGLSKGKAEEEIAEELGNPRLIAKAYKTHYKIDNTENNPSTRNLLTAILAAVSLGFFSFQYAPCVGGTGQRRCRDDRCGLGISARFT